MACIQHVESPVVIGFITDKNLKIPKLLTKLDWNPSALPRIEPGTSVSRAVTLPLSHGELQIM